MLPWTYVCQNQHGHAGAIQLWAQLHCNLLQPSWDGLPGSEHNCPWIRRSQQQSASASKVSHMAHHTLAGIVRTLMTGQQWPLAQIQHKWHLNAEYCREPRTILVWPHLASSCMQNHQPTL